MTVQYRWPLGMPLVRNLGSALWEKRIGGRNANLPRRYSSLARSGEHFCHARYAQPCRSLAGPEDQNRVGRCLKQAAALSAVPTEKGSLFSATPLSAFRILSRGFARVLKCQMLRCDP